MTSRMEFLFFEMRIVTALIAVTIALFYLKFFDSIFRLILENTLSFELSLPVKIYSLTLTLHFPSAVKEENSKGDDFFLMNKVEREIEKKTNGEKAATAVIQKTQMENNLDNINDFKNNKNTEKNKENEKKIFSNYAPTYAQFEKFRYLFAPIKTEKIFRNVPDVVINDNNDSSITHDIEDMKLFYTAKEEKYQSINNLRRMKNFLRNLFNFSLFWDRLISLFLLLHSVRGAVILKNIRVQSPDKEIDARWTNENILTVEKIKITFNFFRSLYYFLFSFTHLIVFDNAFIDGLTINIEGYEEKINACLNRIESNSNSNSNSESKSLIFNEKSFDTPEKEIKIEIKDKNKSASTSDKINNEMINLYNNVLTAITIKIPSPSNDSQNIKKSFFSPPDTPIKKKDLNENLKSKLILNVSLFGKSNIINSDAAIPSSPTSPSSSSLLPVSVPIFPSFSPPFSPSSSSLFSQFSYDNDNSNIIMNNNSIVNDIQNKCPFSSSTTIDPKNIELNKNINYTNNYDNTILEKSESNNSAKLINLTHTNRIDTLKEDKSIGGNLIEKEKELENDVEKEKGKDKDKEKENDKSKIENEDKNKSTEKKTEKESPYNLFNSFIEQAKEQFNNDLQKLNKVDVFIQETAVTLKSKIKHQINEWKAEVTNFQEEVNNLKKIS